VIISIEAIERHIPSRTVALLVVILTGSFFFAQSVLSARSMILWNTHLGQQLSTLKKVLENENKGKYSQDIVIMTRHPWEVYYSTRYKAIQIPNEDLDTIFKVAQKYRANYLLLPAPRKALEGLYRGTQSDERFEIIAAIPDSDMQLFRIKLY